MMTNEHTYNSDDEAKNYDPVDNYGASSDEEHNHPPSKTNNHTTASYGYSDYEDYSDHEDQHSTQARNSFLKQAVSHPSDLVSDLPTSPISSRGARGVRDSYASHTSSHSHRYNTNGSQPAPLHNDDLDHSHIDDYPSSISPRPDTKANSAQQSRRNSWEEDDSEEEPYQAYDYGRDDDSEEEEEEEEEKPHVHDHDQQEQEDKGVEGYYDYSDDEKEEPHHPVHRDSHHEESLQHHQHSPRSSTDSRHSRHHDEDHHHHQVERKSFDEGEPAVSNPNMFQEASENIRASIASAKSYASSHAKHHSFGYDDRPAGYGERSESDSESSTSDPEESPFVDASATTITAAATAISVSAAAATATASAISDTSPPPIPSKSRPTSSSSFSIAAVSARSSVQSRYRPTSITLSETREFKETKQEEKEEVKVVESIVETVTAASIPEPPVVGSSSPTSPVSKSSPLIVDTISQKSVSTASSIDRREKRYSGSESDTSDTSIDLHSPTFKDPVRKATPPTIFNRAMSSTSITRDSNNNRGSSVEKTRPISYATVFSDAEMNDVNLVDEPLNDKRASEIVPPTPSTPSAFGFASSFFGSRNSQPPPPPPKPVAEVAAVASPATPVPATLAAAPVVASPVETRSRSASISALASSISGAFSRGFSTQSQPPVPPLPKTPTGINSQRASNASPAPTSSGITGYFSSNSNRAGSMSDRASITSNQTTDSNMDLLLARLEAQNELLAQDSKRRATTDSEMDRALGHAKEESAGEDYDWDYWGALMHDYNAVVKRNPRQLTTMIQKGVPPALRGLIWQLLAKSKDQNLEGTFAELLKSTSSHEKQITRDMSRTFPNHEHFQAGGPGQEALFDVVKAYSLYDPEVGYCQGLSFVVGPLLLNMPEEEAFCMLVRMMNNYEMRGNYTPDMSTLQLRLYQFEQLMEETVPLVSKHLRNQGIRSTMYASQWFMTLFAYKFPLDLVFRVFDIILVEGIESILRFAVALLKANHDKILSLDFEVLVEFLKDGLFEYYMNNAGLFIQDAYNIKVTPRRLAQYAQKHQANIARQQAELAAEESLKESNKQLTAKVQNLESSMSQLNKEHVDLAKELITRKIEMAHLQDQNDVLTQKVSDLTKIVDSQAKEVEDQFRGEIEDVLRKNMEILKKNEQLEDQLAYMESLLVETKMKYAESEIERDGLSRKLSDMRKALGVA